MSSGFFGSFIIIWTLVTPTKAESRDVCGLEANRKVIEDTSSEFTAFWEFESIEPLLVPDLKEYSVDIIYQKWVHDSFIEHYPYDPVETLIRHRKLISEARWLGDRRQRKVKYMDQVLDLAKTNLRDINCLEAFFHRIHNVRFPLHIQASEFFGEVLINRKTGRVRAYISSKVNDWLGATIGGASNWVKKDLQTGWDRFWHIHNHPYDFSNPYGDFGPICPSEADLATYKEKQYEFISVIDGISSFQLTRRELSRLWILQN